MVKFHESLSEQSVYFRYFHLMQLSQRVAHERLIRICFIDYDREMALVAEGKKTSAGESEILGVGRLSKKHGANEAEFAVLVSDKAQGCGLGTELVRRLLEIGRSENLSRITAEILPGNRAMQRICEELGFRLHHDMNEPVADTARSLLDGHIVLSRALAHQGQYPAIDVLRSVSRLMTDLASPAQRTLATRVRAWLATHRDAEDLLSIGAYRAGTSARIDEAVAKIDAVNAFLRQGLDERVALGDSIAALATLAGAA